MTFELTYKPLETPSNNMYFRRALKIPTLLTPDKEVGCLLVLQSSYALHETIELPAQSLISSWRNNKEYISSSCIGEPPLACYPIYLITVGNKENEKLVYIGKTSSSSSRFTSGHTAISKLHHPKYDGLSKRVYLCCVVFLNGSNEIPIEWVQPFSFAKTLLKSFEANLIYWNQPELNTHHKKNEPVFEYGQVQVQNVTGETDFWHNEIT